jgi:PIN domain nuclease of toxin-antitoxin system
VNVFDASALLTFLQGENGAAPVEEALQEGGACGAANWSEVAQKIRAHGRNWDLSRSLLASYGVQVESVTITDAEWAAQRWVRGEGLSLADRLCMALGSRLDADIWTADHAWGTGDGRIRQIR